VDERDGSSEHRKCGNKKFFHKKKSKEIILIIYFDWMYPSSHHK
jgi:hypothetical protein